MSFEVSGDVSSGGEVCEMYQQRLSRMHPLTNYEFSKKLYLTFYYILYMKLGQYLVYVYRRYYIKCKVI